MACPNCQHTPLERRVGRWGSYYRCPACKTNFSAKKLEQAQNAKAGGEEAEGQ